MRSHDGLGIQRPPLMEGFMRNVKEQRTTWDPMLDWASDDPLSWRVLWGMLSRAHSDWLALQKAKLEWASDRPPRWRILWGTPGNHIEAITWPTRELRLEWVAYMPPWYRVLWGTPRAALKYLRWKVKNYRFERTKQVTLSLLKLIRKKWLQGSLNSQQISWL